MTGPLIPLLVLFLTLMTEWTGDPGWYGLAVLITVALIGNFIHHLYTLRRNRHDHE